jgi:hypothetical protein
MVFGDIYTTKKYRYGKYDFAFDQMVDGITVGAVTGGMRMRLMTVATDISDKAELRLMTESSGQAIVVLADKPYFEALESAMKIRKYVKQRNVTQLSKSVQDIIRDQQDEAGKYEISAADDLKKAIETAEFYVDGEHIEIKGGDAKSKLDQALEYLVAHVYSDLNLIADNADSDADIITILSGDQTCIPGTEPNRDACAKVEEYLEMQSIKNLPTSMADVQSRYQAIPYGWKEIDIAAVVARLIYDQKVTIKYGGATIQPDNKKLPDMLRKKSETGKTGISKHIAPSAMKVKEVKEFLRDYFDVMDVPDDEAGLVKFISDRFKEQKNHYELMMTRYDGRKYPDKALVSTAITLITDVLSQQKDNIALIDAVIKKQNELYDSKDDLAKVESFFKTQVTTFDAAVKFEADMHNDLDYISKDEGAEKALNQVRLITMIPSGGKYDYKRIPELNGLMATVKVAHDKMLEEKRVELLEIVRQCMEAIHTASNENGMIKQISDKADVYYSQKKSQIASSECLALMEGMVPPMWQYKDNALEKMEIALTPPAPQSNKVSNGGGVAYAGQKQPPKNEIIKVIPRQAMFPAKTLKSDEEIDDYVKKVSQQLKQMLKNADGIKIN